MLRRKKESLRQGMSAPVQTVEACGPVDTQCWPETFCKLNETEHLNTSQIYPEPENVVNINLTRTVTHIW